MQKFGLDEEILEKIIAIFKRYEEIESVKIFGSRARGDYREASDIDIALFGDKLTNLINTKVFYDIDSLYLPYKIDLINFNCIASNNTIKKKILEEGVEIYAK